MKSDSPLGNYCRLETYCILYTKFVETNGVAAKWDWRLAVNQLLKLGGSIPHDSIKIFTDYRRVLFPK